MNKKSNSLAELKLIRAKKRFEEASKAFEEAKNGFKEEARKVLQEQRFKQDTGTELTSEDISKAIKKAYEKVFKDAIELQVSKYAETTTKYKNAFQIEISVDGRDAGYDKSKFVASVGLSNSKKFYEIIPKDETLDYFKGGKEDLKKDATDFVKDIYKKAEVSKIIKALKETE